MHIFESIHTFRAAHVTSLNGQTLSFVTVLEASQYFLFNVQVCVHGGIVVRLQ